MLEVERMKVEPFVSVFSGVAGFFCIVKLNCDVDFDFDLSYVAVMHFDGECKYL